MFGALALAALALTAVVVLGVLGSVIALVFWLIVLPFKLLGLVFRGFAFLLLLPLLLVVAIFAALIFGVGFLVFLAPAVPLVLLALGIWWLARRGRHPAVAR